MHGPLFIKLTTNYNIPICKFFSMQLSIKVNSYKISEEVMHGPLFIKLIANYNISYILTFTVIITNLLYISYYPTLLLLSIYILYIVDCSYVVEIFKNRIHCEIYNISIINFNYNFIKILIISLLYSQPIFTYFLHQSILIIITINFLYTYSRS